MFRALALCAVALSPAPAQDPASQILKSALEKLHAAKSYSANVVSKIGGDELKGRISLMKPNFLRYDAKGKESMLFVADGSAYHMHDRTGNRYMKLDLPAHPTQINGAWGAEIDAFFGGPEIETGKASLAGEEKIDGVACSIVRVRKNSIDSAIYAIGKTDGLIHRAEMRMDEDGHSDSAVTLVSGIRLNPPLTAAAFRFAPPTKKPQGMEGADKLLPLGAKAPDFTLRTPQGGAIGLSETLKRNRAVVVNFWFYH